MRSGFYLGELPGKECAAGLFPRWGPQQWSTVLDSSWERNLVGGSGALLWGE